MADEAEIGSAGASDSGGRAGGGGSESTPLQTRAQFLKNWPWASVAEINAGLCERGKAQRGINSETHGPLAEEWQKRCASELTLLDTLRFLKSCHRRAPFLFYNGNTFAEIGRSLANALFYELPTIRRKEAASCIAHFITGVLDEDLMVGSINSLWESVQFAPGDRVKTLRGTTHGVILRIMEDGRVLWLPDGSTSELMALPESLARGKT